MKARTAGAAALAALALVAVDAASAEQDADPAFRSPVTSPSFPPGAGPRVCVDEGHHNFHTLAGRFRAFAVLLESDGYRLGPVTGTFGQVDLGACDVLVIANAMANEDPWDTYPYPTPAAFTVDEAATLRRWVESGGALLLIADHMPFPGAALPLATAFGVEFNDGFAVEGFTTEDEGLATFQRGAVFTREDGSLRSHPVTDGSVPGEAVTQVRTFVGQAFRAPPGAEPLLVFPANFISLMPTIAWRLTMETPRVPVGGWLQGAVIDIGSGRLAVFGEASMFAAQLKAETREPMGMNAPLAEQNWRFVLNLMRWLSAGPGPATTTGTDAR